MVTFGTVRARLCADSYKFTTRSVPNPEDDKIAPLLKLFKVILLVPAKPNAAPAAPAATDGVAAAAAELVIEVAEQVIDLAEQVTEEQVTLQEGVPATAAADEAAALDTIERWNSVHRNSVEQETFLIVASQATCWLLVVACVFSDFDGFLLNFT